MSNIIESTYAGSVETITELNGSKLLVDDTHGIVIVEWTGVVGLITASTLLGAGADMIERHNCTKILLDRRNLAEFDGEARAWIKEELLPRRAKKLVGLVMKVAFVNSEMTKGRVFGNLISIAIRFAFPKLQLEKFDSIIEARNWISE